MTDPLLQDSQRAAPRNPCKWVFNTHKFQKTNQTLNPNGLQDNKYSDRSHKKQLIDL